MNKNSNITHNAKLAQASNCGPYSFVTKEVESSTDLLVKSFKRTARDSTDSEQAASAPGSSTWTATCTASKLPKLLKPVRKTKTMRIARPRKIHLKKTKRDVASKALPFQTTQNEDFAAKSLMLHDLFPLQRHTDNADGQPINMSLNTESSQYNLEDFQASQLILNLDTDGSIVLRGQEAKEVFNAFASDCFGNKWVLQAWEPAAFHVHSLMK
jgi:hypothetical protein